MLSLLAAALSEPQPPARSCVAFLKRVPPAVRDQALWRAVRRPSNAWPVKARVIRVLLEHGAQCSQAGELTSLMGDALGACDAEALRPLLERVDPNSDVHPSMPGVSILARAVCGAVDTEADRLATLRVLLEFDADPLSLDVNGDSAVDLAARRAGATAVSMLLEKAESMHGGLSPPSIYRLCETAILRNSHEILDVIVRRARKTSGFTRELREGLAGLARAHREHAFCLEGPP